MIFFYKKELKDYPLTTVFVIFCTHLNSFVESDMQLEKAIQICNNMEAHFTIKDSPFKYQQLVSAVSTLTSRIAELENELLLCAEIIDEQTNLHPMAAIMKQIAKRK